MARVALYIGIENLALNDDQRDTLVTAIIGLGRENGSPDPSRHMQPQPVRLDNQAAIFEAAFDNTDFSLAAWKARLAAVFGVSAASITSTVNTPSFGAGTSTLVTFGRGGTDYIRSCVFGGINATHEQSRLECMAYLDANSAQWREVL